MEATLATHVANLISQGNVILQGLQQELDRLEAATAVATRGILAEGAGALASEILGTKKATTVARKATRAFLKSSSVQDKRTIIAKYEVIAAGWESDVVRFLKQVSTCAPRLTTPGNSDSLIKRVHQARRYKKVETRVKHILTELEAMRNEGLVFNTNLPQTPPKPLHAAKSPDASEVLMELEVALRRFIERELGKVDKEWWLHVPPEINKNAERRRSRSEGMYPWHPPTSTNVVDYLDFSDYYRIILWQDNWERVFAKFFKRRSFVEVRLGELDPIRNDIAHSRPVTPEAVAKLNMFTTELLNCMNPR